MKTISHLIFLIILGFTLQSCEGQRCSSGKILDKSTNLPLDSVQVKMLSSKVMFATDSTGLFDVCGMFGGCMPCKDILVEFSKEGYQTQTMTNSDTGIIVLLER